MRGVPIAASEFMKTLHTLLTPLLLLGLAAQELSPVSLALISSFDVSVLMEELVNGLTHIIPDGLDHLAFLLGLFFLSRNLPTLLLQVTIFTLAHSLTLGLVILLGLNLPPQWVEVAVGLSIALLALEGFYPKKLQRWRPLMIILFGGVHGLAFAHNLLLTENLRRSPLAALFGFNLGVECGQIFVVGILVLAFAPWWQRAWYQRRVAQPLLAAVAFAGLAWAVQRWPV